MDSTILDLPQFDSFSGRLERVLAGLRASADDADAASSFVEEGIEGLREIGALRAPFPPELGGQGIGTIAAASGDLLDLLRRVGRASLSLGRVFEGHINAVRLVVIYGTREQARQAAQDAGEGHLFGIWAAERPEERVRIDDQGNLTGRKAFASAAGHVERALITAELPDGSEQLVLVPLPPFAANAGQGFDLHGMRSAGTAPYRFDGIRVPCSALVGDPGDYMREPEISLGAWRTLAVQLGGLDGLLSAYRDELNRRARATDPHQLERFGRALIAAETARLWMERSADLGAGGVADLESVAQYIRLARLAVERACLEAIALAQRSVGLTGFVRPHPVERISRDLSTYLRQPALDMVLDEAAEYFLVRDLP